MINLNCYLTFKYSSRPGTKAAEYDDHVPEKEKQRIEKKTKLKELEPYFANKPLPGADWVGWKDGVDMNDIKLKYADKHGMDAYDLDLWESRRRNMARRNYLNASSSGVFASHSIGGASGMLNVLRTIAFGGGAGSYNQMEVSSFGDGGVRGYFSYGDNRYQDIMNSVWREHR